MHRNAPSPACARRLTKRGFTLIELLTVIAIIGILAAILIPTVGSVRAKAKAVKCTSQLRSWGDAVRLFANDNKGAIGLLINVSSDQQMHFYSSYLPRGNDGVTKTNIDPMEFFSVCPSIDRTGQDSTDTNRRYYNFLDPKGSKTIPANGKLGNIVVTKAVKYYTLESARTPSRLILMTECTPGSDSPLDSNQYSGVMTDRVKPLLIGNDKTLIRHNGVVNVLFLDGSVRSQRWEDLQFNVKTANGDPRYTL